MSNTTQEIRKHQIKGIGATKTYYNKVTGHKVIVHPIGTYEDGTLRVFCGGKINGQARTRMKLFNPNHIANKDEARGRTIAEFLSIFTDHSYTYHP